MRKVGEVGMINWTEIFWIATGSVFAVFLLVLVVLKLIDLIRERKNDE